MKDITTSRRDLLGIAALSAAALFFVGRASLAAPLPRFPLRKSPAEWRKALGPARYAVLREGATERAFTSPLNREHRRGTFVCAGCRQPLFSSAAKFDSGTGWPSFFQVKKGAVVKRRDLTLGMVRTEVLCSRCGGHLGHLFEDGPKPTGLRYCMNGLALRFVAA